MTTRFEIEAEACAEKWGKTGILKNLSTHKKLCTAVMLENQRLMNEMRSDSADIAQFKRISIPLVRRIIPNMIAFDLVSVQPLLGPCGLAYYYAKNKLQSTDIAASTMKMKTVWTYEAQQDLRSAHNLDAEAELTAIVAQEICLEFDRMVLTDLRTHSALSKTIDYNCFQSEVETEKLTQVKHTILDLAKESQETYGRPFANWMVTSPEVVEGLRILGELSEEDNDSKHGFFGPHKVGVLKSEDGDIKVFQDPLFPTGGVLMGYKGESDFDAGYVLAPYVLLTQTPTVLDPDTFVPRKGVMSRFGKKMIDPTYYSYLTVKNFKLEDKENPLVHRQEPVVTV